MLDHASAAMRRGPVPSTRVSLLDGVRGGPNAQAWQAFIDVYTPLVFGYCRRRGLQESDARDVTQNVFFAVSRAVVSFDYDPGRGRFRSWLRTITCREIRRYLSWVNRLQGAAEDVAKHLGCDLESEWENRWNAYLLQQALVHVRPCFAADVWSAFELTWIDDYGATEAAKRLDRTVAWVYKAKYRVLMQLRQTVRTLAEDVPLRPR